jgi:hypothetical protein
MSLVAPILSLSFFLYLFLEMNDDPLFVMADRTFDTKRGSEEDLGRSIV